MSTSKYIVGGELQPEAILTDSLLQECTITAGDLLPPKQSSTGKITTEKDDGRFNDDYYTGYLELKYPDDTTTRTFWLPNVIVYNKSRKAGPKNIRWAVAIPKHTASILEKSIQKSYKGFVFTGSRYTPTNDVVWVEIKIFTENSEDQNKFSKDNVPKTNALPSKPPMKVSLSKTVGNKRNFIPYEDLQDMFANFSSAVAIKGSLAVTINMQAQVKKGNKLPSDARAIPTFVPSEFKMQARANIPEPRQIGSQRTVASALDDADDDLFNEATRTVVTDANDTPKTEDDDEFVDSGEED